MCDIFLHASNAIHFSTLTSDYVNAKKTDAEFDEQLLYVLGTRVKVIRVEY